MRAAREQRPCQLQAGRLTSRSEWNPRTSTEILEGRRSVVKARTQACDDRAFSLTGRGASRRLARMRSLFLAVALAVVGLASLAIAEDAPAPPRIYRWIDENGIAHYTTDPDQIPKSLLRRFGLPAQPLAREPLDPRAPASLTPSAPARPPDAWAGEEMRAAPAVEAGAPPEAPADWPNETVPGAPVAQAAAESAPPDRLAQLELRIAELSASIAADEDALSAFIGEPTPDDAVEIADQPAFREIAGRLPKRLQELEALRAERDALRSETTP